MKKLLLSALLVSGFAASAQTLMFDNFEDLTLGEVGTDITGVTPGQGEWLTFASNGAAPTTSTNAANSNFEVVASGFEGQGVKLTGPNGNKGSRFMWKAGFADIWATRDVGNDIVEVELDLYTGAPTGSSSRSGVRLYGFDGATSRVLNGFVFNTGTKVLSGVAYLNNNGTFGTYLINLATGGLILEADTWYKIGFGYDTATGQPFWKVDGDAEAGSMEDVYWAPSADFIPDEVDLVYDVPATPVNTEASDVTFDNFLVEAVAAESLLGLGQVGQDIAFSVFPNPATTLLNVTAPAEVSISQIVMTDLNGRTVKTVKFDGVTSTEVSISDLASGVYTLKVVSNMGTSVKKVIKQ